MYKFWSTYTFILERQYLLFNLFGCLWVWTDLNFVFSKNLSKTLTPLLSSIVFVSAPSLLCLIKDISISALSEAAVLTDHSNCSLSLLSHHHLQHLVSYLSERAIAASLLSSPCPQLLDGIILIFKYRKLNLIWLSCKSYNHLNINLYVPVPMWKQMQRQFLTQIA